MQAFFLAATRNSARNKRDKKGASMDWLQFFSSVISSLAWPVTVVLVVYLLRGQLAQLVKDISSFEWDKLKITIGERLTKVSETVEATAPITAEAPAPAEAADDQFVEMAKIDPIAAVVHSWVPVEREILELVKRMGLKPAKSFLSNANMLHAQGVLDEATMRNLANLRSIRNDALHASERDITVMDAIVMAETCRKIVAQLQDVNDTLDY